MVPAVRCQLYLSACRWAGRSMDGGIRGKGLLLCCTMLGQGRAMRVDDGADHVIALDAFRESRPLAMALVPRWASSSSKLRFAFP